MQLRIDIMYWVFYFWYGSIIVTGLWASIVVTCSSSSCLLLCALALVLCCKSHPPLSPSPTLPLVHIPLLLQFSTPLEKLYCFKKCISTLTEMPLEGAYESMRRTITTICCTESTTQPGGELVDLSPPCFSCECRWASANTGVPGDRLWHSQLVRLLVWSLLMCSCRVKIGLEACWYLAVHVGLESLALNPSFLSCQERIKMGG